jgi:hypothetical protein
MKKTKPSKTLSSNMKTPERVESLEVDSGSMEGLEGDARINERVPQTRKRAYFDKEGHLLKRQGHRFRVDHLKTYKIHSALKGISQQELMNLALEYYRIHVLQKSQAQKLKEAGVKELDI